MLTRRLLSFDRSIFAWSSECALGYNCPPPTLPTLSPYGPQSRYFDVSQGANSNFTWLAVANHSSVELSTTNGAVFVTDPTSWDQRIEVFVKDWSAVPDGKTLVTVSPGICRLISRVFVDYKSSSSISNSLCCFFISISFCRSPSTQPQLIPRSSRPITRSATRFTSRSTNSTLRPALWRASSRLMGGSQWMPRMPLGILRLTRRARPTVRQKKTL